MKKLLILMAVIMPFFLTSCSDDKDEPTLEQQLIGQWIEIGDFDLTNLKFNSDHTGSQWATVEGVIEPGSEHAFTWSLSGDKITIKSGSETIVSTIYFKNGQLHIVDDGDDGDDIAFRKIQ